MIRGVVKFFGILPVEQLFYHFELKDMHKPHVVPPFENIPKGGCRVNITRQIYTAPLPVQEHTADNDRYQLKECQINGNSGCDVRQV